MVENWLRVDEAAGRLGFSRSKVYQMINDGFIPSVRVANRIRISTSDLEAWVRSQPSGRCREGQGLPPTAHSIDVLPGLTTQE